MGVTTGLNPTTYDPGSGVTRLQMAAFLARTVDRTLQRGSRRAALGQFWTTQLNGLMMTTVGLQPGFLRSDGADVWVSSVATVSRVRASDGRLLETWTGTNSNRPVLAARGSGLHSRRGNPRPPLPDRSPAGRGRRHDRGEQPRRQYGGDGLRWGQDLGVDPGPGRRFGRCLDRNSGCFHPLDGNHRHGWFPGIGGRRLRWSERLGHRLQCGDAAQAGLRRRDSPDGHDRDEPAFPAFDGSNIWVPNGGSATVTVVRASTGAVLQTLSGNGLVQPPEAAFDGQRILVTNNNGNTVSLFKAADLSSAGFLLIGGTPTGVCSDGVSFWIALQSGVRSRDSDHGGDTRARGGLVMKSSSFPERRGLALLLVAAGLASGGVASLFGACGPFGDTAADAFCPFVLEVFYLGITTGTTVTTYDPASNVTGCRWRHSCRGPSMESSSAAAGGRPCARGFSFPTSPAEPTRFRSGRHPTLR